MTTTDTPRSEYPRPQLRRDEWQCLNGEWGFERDLGKSGRARGLPATDALAETITVPFPPESDLSGIGERDFMKSVWYQREIDVSNEWFDGRILLHFGAIDYESEVWINGESIGIHRGGYTPFTLDITDAVSAGTNVVTVCVRDEVRSGKQAAGKQSRSYESHGANYTRVTGIWQTVWLEPVPETYIEDLRLTPDIDNECLHGEVTLAGDSRDMCVGACAAFDGQEVGSVDVSVAGDHAMFTLDLDEVHPWSPDDPALYDLTVTLFRGDAVDTVESYFGLRSIAVEEGVVYLNGEPVFQRLVLDQGYYPDGLYTAPSDEALRRDIEIGKKLGFNGARLHEKVFEPRFLYHADRLGYLVWGEYGDWQLDRTDPGNLGPFLQEWLEVLERDFNHPSIVGWTPFNETHSGRDADLLRTVYRTTKQIDPTRPVIDSSGYQHVETDILDIHDYTQDAEEFRERYAPLADGEGIDPPYDHGDSEYGPELSYVSECGGIWWNPDAEEGWGYGHRPESEEEFIERYRELTEALLDNPEIGLFCYTQLYDIEQEVNGLYTYDRKPKFDPDVFREINEQSAAIEQNDS
jgi:beta-galactosidase/beta-glucuronidase